jgi:uncharacterized lipoprotein YajG
MLRRFAMLVVSLGVAVLLFARGNLKELTVPLKFVPQEGVHASNPDLQPGLLTTTVVVQVEDARNQSDPLVIGQGTGGDDKLFPIHADKSPVEFIHDVVNGVSTQWGLKQQTPAARTLTLQITRFFIDESNKAVGSVYGTEVKIAYTLKDAKGNTLATGATSGTAHRYGRAHSPENINEVLSDSLKEAYSNVLSDQALQSAWVSGKAAATSAAPVLSAEERLRKLDDLLKKDLITKEEYATKRAAILKDM